VNTKKVIEIKKAIKFLKNIKDNMYYPPEDKDKNIDKIIALLQQGEKYRQIIEKIYRILNPIRAFKVITIQDRLDILHNIQQILKDEYFSKEMSKNTSLRR